MSYQIRTAAGAGRRPAESGASTASAFVLTITAAVMLAVFVSLGGTACSRGRSVAEPGHGESILDRIEHIEPSLVTAVPSVPRWCDIVPGLDKRRIDVGGASLYVELEGRGAPLVLINGGPGGTHHYFHPWFSRLKDQALIVYYDQRGCGLSDFKPGKEGYSVEQAVEDLDAVRRALGFEKWTVLGYSYGGFLAQLYAVVHPERVSGLILLGASTGMKADDGPTRQGDYMSEAEKRRLDGVAAEIDEYADAHELTGGERTALVIYNNSLNGDWKRQNFYRPLPESMARAARYEWVNDRGFNATLGATEGRWDLTSAFEGSPIPTLILEGKHDLTWAEKKKDMLKANHPGARMMVIDGAGHGIYDEAPDAFFTAVRGFLQGLPPVDVGALAAYRTFLTGWTARMKARPDLVVDVIKWDRGASREIASRYDPKRLDTISDETVCLRTGFALYDVGRYAEALKVFEVLEVKFGASDTYRRVMGIIWQAHMLDLLGRRPEAVALYSRVSAMNIDSNWTHSQYGFKYRPSPYARERMKVPFTRLENRLGD